MRTTLKPSSVTASRREEQANQQPLSEGNQAVLLVGSSARNEATRIPLPTFRCSTCRPIVGMTAGPLLAEEFALLVAAAEAGPVVESIPGPDRAMMYILSAWTGYRKGEIGSLTIQSFDLNSDPPTVTVQAAFSKRKRTRHAGAPSRRRDTLDRVACRRSPSFRPTSCFPVSGKVPGGTERKTPR